MRRNLIAIALGLGFILLVGLGERALSNFSAQNASGNAAALFGSRGVVSSKGFGNLCSSRSGCFIVCKNNVGRCQNYCKKNPSHQFCKLLPAAKPLAWVPNAITQPLPPGASKVRLVLPAPLDALPFHEIGAFGAHRGGHPEGLDHEWIPVKEGVVQRSWGDGEVVWARRAPGDAGYEYGVRNIVVYYGDGLWGEHMGILTALVTEGQKIKAGDPVGYSPVGWGAPFLVKTPGYQAGEFNLVDQHRRDGIGYWYKFVPGASFVSPFDYLRDDIKMELEERWQKEILSRFPTLTDYNSITPTPWEPYLTNPLFFHKDHAGTLVGEWFLRSKPWGKDDAPDVLILLPVQSPYYQKQRVIAVNDDLGGSNDLHGDWTADYAAGRSIFETDRGMYYGIFEIDEGKPQATLKIEYQKDAYPEHFSSRALTYAERDAVSKSEELHYWKNPQDDPRRW